MEPLLSFNADAVSFQVASGELLKELVSDCAVAAFQGYDRVGGDLTPFKALWGTGATNSVITERVVAECNLVPTGQVRLEGINSSHIANTYVVSILLHGMVLFPVLTVTEGDFTGADVLIGMDIISRGDFAVTNKDGETAFMYRYPSEGVDFVGFEEDED